MKELKIVIAEDSAALSEMLERTLSVIDGFSVIGKATDGVEAVRLVEEMTPHVLVLDITMPRMDGIEALKEIRKRDDATTIIMYTADASPFLRKICYEAGANYFLDKSRIIELIEICRQKLLAS